MSQPVAGLADGFLRCYQNYRRFFLDDEPARRRTLGPCWRFCTGNIEIMVRRVVKQDRFGPSAPGRGFAHCQEEAKSYEEETGEQQQAMARRRGRVGGVEELEKVTG